MNLSPEQMQFLADKGLSLAEIIEFARVQPARTSSAERQARYRARKKAEGSENVTSGDVTRDVTERDTAPLSLPPNENNSNPPTHTPGNTPCARKADDFPCPDWADPQVWMDLKRNRRTKKLTNTPTAHKRFLAAVEDMADDHWPPGKLLEAIVAKGWGGPHDPREDRKPGNDNRQRAPTTGTSSSAERVRARFAAGRH